jgi:hypothetical protein
LSGALEAVRAELETHRWHYIQAVGGKVADVLWPDDAKNGVTVDQSAADPAFAALWTGYRDALSTGTAKLERDGLNGGHTGYWLRFPSIRSGLPGTEVAIDRQTYKPVVFRECIPTAWNAIPPGAVAVQTAEAGSGKKTTQQWTGSLVKGGVYATVETTRGEDALLAVARALRPAR